MSGESPVVALIGLRCVGKTAVGRELARLTGARFVDLDGEILAEWLSGAEAAGATEALGVGDVLTRLGVERFRKLELALLERLLEHPQAAPMVLATGAGCVESSGARALLARAACCVWLREELARLVQRLSLDPAARPALTDLDPQAEFQELARRRDPLYRALAQVRVDCRGEGLQAVALRVLDELPGAWSTRPPAPG